MHVSVRRVRGSPQISFSLAVLYLLLRQGLSFYLELSSSCAVWPAGPMYPYCLCVPISRNAGMLYRSWLWAFWGLDSGHHACMIYTWLTKPSTRDQNDLSKAQNAISLVWNLGFSWHRKVEQRPDIHVLSDPISCHSLCVPCSMSTGHRTYAFCSHGLPRFTIPPFHSWSLFSVFQLFSHSLPQHLLVLPNPFPSPAPSQLLLKYWADWFLLWSSNT